MTARSLFRRLRRDKNRYLPWKSLWQRPGIVSGLLGASEHYQLSDDIASGNTEYRISRWSLSDRTSIRQRGYSLLREECTQRGDLLRVNSPKARQFRGPSCENAVSGAEISLRHWWYRGGPTNRGSLALMMPLRGCDGSVRVVRRHMHRIHYVCL